MHRENWDDLRYVLAVADAGSVAAAARALGVNHATVLRRVAQFEARHEIMVFDRVATGYDVTAQARNIIEAIREAGHAVSAVTRLARDGNRPLQGDVRITSTDTLSAFILPKIVQKISCVEKDLRIEVLSSNAYVDMSRSIADITVRPTPELPNDMSGQSAGVLSFGVYARSDEAAPAKWLGLSGDLSRSRPAVWMASNVPDEQVVAGADSFMTLRDMAVSGLGRSFLPCFVGDASEHLARVKGLPDMSVELWVASHQSLTNTPRIARVRTLLVEMLLQDAPILSGAT